MEDEEFWKWLAIFSMLGNFVTGIVIGLLLTKAIML